MCGRTCLTLAPDEVQCACKYQPYAETKEKIKPEWRSEYNCGKNYEPSHNIAPTDVTPVLVSSAHFGLEADTKQRMLVPMLWGMIPSWHKGDYRKHGLTTNNCRLEHLLESKLYSRPFRKGQRCVVVCEGFYEWQTTKTAKPSERAAHYIYMTQDDEIKISDRKTWHAGNIRLLKMAGLFDVWENENGDKIFSYSVITYESSSLLSWMHHRMPAILEDDQQVANWLNYSKMYGDEALSILRPVSKLCWYQVSNIVNNSRNKSTDCNKPLQELKNAKGKVVPKSKIMEKWLTIRKRKEESIINFEDDDDDNIDSGRKTKNKKPRLSRSPKSTDVLCESESPNCSKENMKDG